MPCAPFFVSGAGFALATPVGKAKVGFMDMDIRIVIDVLVELAECEDELAGARATLDRLRKRTRGRGELAAEYGEDADVADGARREAESGYRRRDREIRELEAGIVARRERLVGLADRRQHRALTEEISAQVRRLDKLETEALDLLEEADERSGEAGEARREASTLAEAEPKAAALEAETVAEIRRLMAMLPPDVARHVVRLRRGDGRSVARLENGACSGCFGLLPAHQAIAVDKGQALVRCTTCTRFVVHRPWR